MLCRNWWIGEYWERVDIVILLVRCGYMESFVLCRNWWIGEYWERVDIVILLVRCGYMESFVCVM